jgi:hypothetical protein
LQDQRWQQQQAPKDMAVKAKSLAIGGLQQKLSEVDPNKDPAQYHELVSQIQEQVHGMRELINPDQKLGASDWLKAHTTDWLHITNHDKRVKSLAAKNAAGVAQDAGTAQSLALGSVPDPAVNLENLRAKNAIELQKLKNDAVTQKGGSTRPVPYYAGAVNLKTAASMADQGVQFQGADGAAYDLSKLPENSVLIPVYEGGGKSYWSVATDKGRYETAGNQRLIEPSVGGPNPEAPSIGPVRVPTTSTSTATAPGGGQVVTGTRTSVPANSGVPSTTPNGATPKSPGPVLQKRPAAGGAPSPKEESQSILPDISKMTPQNAAAARKAQPAVTALLGLYGDPQNPSAPSMIQYAGLANDPHAQQVLGEAFKLLDQQMGEISDPGILQTLGTAAGWANFRAQAEAGAQQAAGTQMTPQERAYFDAAISSMADIIGSRSATGQSAARFSVRSIQNELPLIGLSGTPDTASYLTKMQTIGRQVRVGLNAMPDNSRAMAWLNRQELAIRQMAKSAGGKTIVQQSPSTGKYRYSTDGGQTWQPGKPQSQTTGKP